MRSFDRTFAIGLIVGLFNSAPASAQPGASQTAPLEQWVSTWGTSLLLTPAVPRRPPSTLPGSGAAAATVPATAAPRAAPVSSGPPPHNLPDNFEDQTFRMIVRTSLGGTRLRITLSNMLNAEPLQIGAAHLAIHAGQGAIDPKSDRALTFSGESSLSVPPGVLVVSDPVDLPIAPGADLIDGYEQIIARGRAHGIRLVGATLTPQEGQFTATEEGERARQAANAWIRTSGRFDAVVDFDAAVRDPHRPARLKPAFDPGDQIHPNDAGNEAMAAAFDLDVFTKR